MRSDLIQIAYIAAAVLFILGLKSMSSPRTARRGIIWAGVGMLVATAITFATPEMGNFVWMTLALVIGGAIAYVAARRVAMTDMPQMVAIYNGMGGGAAALIAAVEFMKPETMPTSFAVLGIIGALIGSVSFSGSMIAFAKLQGIIKKSFLFPGQNVVQPAGPGRRRRARGDRRARSTPATWAATRASSWPASSPSRCSTACS